MKRILLYILSLIILAGCSESYDDSLGLYPTLTPRYLSVSPTSITFDANQTTPRDVVITSTQTPWSIENAIEWISTSPNSGSENATVQVYAEENTAGDQTRVGVFYVRSGVDGWNYEQPMSVTQAGAQPIIELSKGNSEYSGTQHNDSFTVSSNCSWEATSNADWLTVTTEGNVVSFSMSANTTTSYRTASIIVEHHGYLSLSKTITIKQAPANINASTETLVFNNTAAQVTITINSEAPWVASTSESWIELSPTSGDAGTTTLVISVSPNTSINERTGNVILSVGGNQRISIPIRQRGIYIEPSQNSLTFEANGGGLSLGIESNTSWTVSSNVNWLSFSETQGTGNKTITVTAQDNPYTTNRSATITFTQPGTSLKATVEVNQKGKTFDVATTILNFNDKASTQTVQIETDGHWTATASDSWITISPSNATGNSILTVGVTENFTDSERNGTVVIKMGDKTATIAVVQSGKYFTISNSLLNFTSRGGNINVSITTNGNWSATVDEAASSWLSLSKKSGTGNVEVTVTAADNPSVNSRSGSIYFKTPYNTNVRVDVTQSARYLTVDMNEILFYSKGGTSEPITVSTDGTYNITSTVSWLTINRTGDTFTVTATENTGTEARFGKINLTLTGLTEGSYKLTIDVTQLNYGGTFLRKEYDPDVNWDNNGNTSGNITINPFGSDHNYDNPYSGNVSLSISSWLSDKSWDTSVTSHITVTITGFKSDGNLDNNVSTSGNVSRYLFGNDNNWE